MVLVPRTSKWPHQFSAGVQTSFAGLSFYRSPKPASICIKGSGKEMLKGGEKTTKCPSLLLSPWNSWENKLSHGHTRPSLEQGAHYSEVIHNALSRSIITLQFKIPAFRFYWGVCSILRGCLPGNLEKISWHLPRQAGLSDITSLLSSSELVIFCRSGVQIGTQAVV